MSDNTELQPRVLIVEDEQLVAADLEFSLHRLGFSVLPLAETGLSAIRLAEQQRPDVILMDIQLEGKMDGVEAAQEIVRRWDIPVVFLSANTNDEVVRRAKATGPYGYLDKPFRLQELNATLQVALQQNRRARELSSEIQATQDALGQTRAELRGLSAHLMSAQEEERRRLAQDLHDDFGQRMAVLKIEADRLTRLVQDNVRATEALARMRAQIEAVAEGLRHKSHDLHPSILSELGLVPGIRSLADEFKNNGLDIGFQARGIPPNIPIEVATALYRITQEALTNVAKYCRDATTCISISLVDNSLHLIVEDNGPGFDLSRVRVAGGLGLLSMQERARAVGGTMTIHTVAGKGTQLTVQVASYTS